MKPHYKQRLAWFLTLLVLMAPAAYAIESAYRLTGVIGSTAGKLFAVIEEADGEQHLLSEGDEIGDGQVLAIFADSRTVVLRFRTGDILLGLNGSAQEYVEQYSGQYVEPSVARTPAQGGNEHGSISLNAAGSDKLAQLAAASGKLGEAESTVRLKQLLSLPADANIVALNGRRLGSTQHLLRSLQRDLPGKMESGGHLGTILVSTEAGKSRVYLMVNSKPQGQP